MKDLGKNFGQTRKSSKCFEKKLHSRYYFMFKLGVHGFRRVFSAVYSSDLYRYADGKNLNEGSTLVL